MLLAEAIVGELVLERGEMEIVKYLARGINNLRCELLLPIRNDLAEGVLNGRIVAVDKVPVDILHCQARFACAWSGQLLLTCLETRSTMLHYSPTALLPTMATFRCFGGAGGILLSLLGGGREQAERLARFEVWRSQSSAET